MAATYYSILTKAGLAKASNSLALGIPFAISAIALGDGNGQAVLPNADMTKLVKEVFRAQVNDLKPVPATPGLFIAELYVPLEVGGFTVREMGLYDDKGGLLAVCNTPPTPKLDASSGASSEQIFRFSLLLTNAVNPVIMIDPSTVVATRSYVDEVALNAYPVGSPIPWPTAVPPTGYIAMTGQSFNAATYPKLALAYPALVLPDMRAEFIRGWDAGRGGDLNRSILTNQSDLTKAHSHHISANAPTSHDEGWKLGAIRSDTYPAGRGIPATADTGSGSFVPSPSGHSIGAIGIVGGVETRPRNIAFNYIVRAA